MKLISILGYLATFLGYAYAACDVTSLIKTNEGYRTCVYTDTKGNPTIGIGFNLNRADAPPLLASVGANYASVRSGATCLTDSQIITLFNGDVSNARNCAQRINPFFPTLKPNAQSVVTDLVFNLGCAGYSKFTGFAGFLKNGDYTGAANDLKTTLWCNQVGLRCGRDVNCLLT